jgi:hypothetical protein
VPRRFPPPWSIDCFAVRDKDVRSLTSWHFGHAETLMPVDNTTHCGGRKLATATLLARLSVVRGWHMSVQSEATSAHLPPRRQVSIGRDGEDFVVSFQPHNIVVFRHDEADPLRRICHSLGWEILSDTVPDPDNLASWCRIESRRLTR